MTPEAANRAAALIVAVGVGFAGGAYAARQAPPPPPAPVTYLSTPVTSDVTP